MSLRPHKNYETHKILSIASIIGGLYVVKQERRHPTKRAAVSSTFREMAITIAAVMSLRRGTRLSLKAS
jgi:hypothetical protein